LEQFAVLSEWMKVFGPAIYGTRIVAPYRTGKYAYTKSKDGRIVNIFYLYEEGEAVPAKYEAIVEGQVLSVTDMRTGLPLTFEQKGDCLRIQLPEELAGRSADIADCFIVQKR